MLNDGFGERVLLGSSNSSFSLYATLTSSDPDVSPIISDDGVSLYVIDYIINNMGISNDCINLISTGGGYNANTISVTISNPDIGSNNAILAYNLSANGNLTSIYVSYPGALFLTTPTITITDAGTRSGNASAVVIVTGETSSSGGNAFCKYFTKKVILTPANDSGDLRVYLTAYVPTGNSNLCIL